MNAAAELAARARFELEDAFARTRGSWQDRTADHYYRRFHAVAVDKLNAYVRAAEELENSLERAEAAASRRD